MHNPTIPALVATIAIGVVTTNANAIYDDFLGSTINGNSWIAITPYSDSAINVGGSMATFSNHGELVTQDSFAVPYEVSGRFQFTGNYHDSFNIAIRTSGAHSDTRFYDNGFMMTVAKQTDDGWRHDLVRITKNNAIVIDATYPFSLNQIYDFKITDDGSQMDFYFGDLATPLVSVTDTDTYGGKVGFYNREGTGGGSSISAGSHVQIDYLAVQAVPETTSHIENLAMAALGAGSLFIFRRLSSSPVS